MRTVQLIATLFVFTNAAACAPEGNGCPSGTHPNNGRCFSRVPSWDACVPGFEACDGADNDCDGITDEDHASACPDCSGPDCPESACVFGVEIPCACPAGTRRACGPEFGECAPGVQRCEDGRWTACAGGIGPSSERCDGLDNDCDGVADEELRILVYLDRDYDGYGDPAHSCSVCGLSDTCQEPGRWVANALDCDDDCDVCFSGSEEACDGLDGDCDGHVDEGVTQTFYRDVDGDGYGNPASPGEFCTPVAGFAARAGDCADRDPRANPAQEAIFETPVAERGGFDFNCDGQDDRETRD